MGEKQSTGSHAGGLQIDADLLTTLVIALQNEANNVDGYKVDLVSTIKVLEDAGDIITGDRADAYKEALNDLKGLTKNISEATAQMKAAAYKANSACRLNLNNKAKDTKAISAAEKAQKLHNKKLKGN